MAVSLFGFGGCKALAPIGPAEPAAAYARGDLEGGVEGDYRKAIEAAKGALADLNLALVSEVQDAKKAVLVSRTPGDKRIEIQLGNSDNTLTNIKIRVGNFGDEQVSRKIFNRIKTRL